MSYTDGVTIGFAGGVITMAIIILLVVFVYERE